MPVDIHNKVNMGKPVQPLYHSLEHRIAALRERFDAIEQALAAASTKPVRAST
jgi:hypothetical protein